MLWCPSLDPIHYTFSNERSISIEVSAETLKTTEALETTTGLGSVKTRGEPGLGNQTTSSPGR